MRCTAYGLGWPGDEWLKRLCWLLPFSFPTGRRRDPNFACLGKAGTARQLGQTARARRAFSARLYDLRERVSSLEALHPPFTL